MAVLNLWNQMKYPGIWIFCELALLAYQSVFSSLPVLEQPLALSRCYFAFLYRAPLRSVDTVHAAARLWEVHLAEFLQLEFSLKYI